MALLSALGRDNLISVLTLCSTVDVCALACACKELSATLKDDILWRELAELKWGRHVKELAQVEPGGWAAWTKHRLSVRSRPVSPLDLVQEHYQDCPFQHMAACLLCSRTTGGPAVRQAIQSFLALYPTPSAVIDADGDSLLEVMRPLGLQAVRMAALRGLARDFLATEWQSPHEFKHCGSFVTDSWRIFCRGYRSLHGVEDKNLQRYVRWLLSGEFEEHQSQKSTAGSSRKRKAEPAARAGTLRSGRRRGAASAGISSRGQAPAAQRRLTRAATSAEAAKATGVGGGTKRAAAGSVACPAAPKAARGRRA